MSKFKIIKINSEEDGNFLYKKGTIIVRKNSCLASKFWWIIMFPIDLILSVLASSFFDYELELKHYEIEFTDLKLNEFKFYKKKSKIICDGVKSFKIISEWVETPEIIHTKNRVNKTCFIIICIFFVITVIVYALINAFIS